MKISFSIGRFNAGPTIGFLRALHDAAKASRKRTEAERRIQRINYSIENDFREGFSSRQHGDDARTIAKREVEKVELVKKAELVQAEIEQLRAEIEAGERWLAEKQARLTELDNSRGSGVFLARRLEIEAARRRSEVA